MLLVLTKDIWLHVVVWQFGGLANEEIKWFHGRQVITLTEGQLKYESTHNITLLTLKLIFFCYLRSTTLTHEGLEINYKACCLTKKLAKWSSEALIWKYIKNSHPRQKMVYMSPTGNGMRNLFALRSQKEYRNKMLSFISKQYDIWFPRYNRDSTLKFTSTTTTTPAPSTSTPGLLIVSGKISIWLQAFSHNLVSFLQYPYLSQLFESSNWSVAHAHWPGTQHGTTTVQNLFEYISISSGISY